MEGVLAFDFTQEGWPKELLDQYVPEVRRGVLAGRKFLFPTRDGFGDFEGIILLEGTATGSLEGSKLEFSHPEGDVRRIEAKEGIYFVMLGPQRTLYATTEAVMREALQVRGASGRVLAARMGWSDGVPWESPLVLLRKPDAAILDEATQEHPRTALWLTTHPVHLEKDEMPPCFRVTNLAMHVTDAARLEFTAKVKLRDSIEPDQLPRHPTLWETWGGPGFEQMEARMEHGFVLMTGIPRGLAEDPSSAFVLAFLMIGVRIYI
jgi:hypothetical protein